MKNLVSYLNVSSNSLLLALIILILVLIILVIILIIKSSNNKKENKINKSSYSNSILNIDIDNLDDNEIEEVKIAKKIEFPKEQQKGKFDLSETAKKMEENLNNDNIDLTEFEIEQEEKSIISYQELLERVRKEKNQETKIKTDENKYNFTEKNKIDNEYTFSTEIVDFESDINDEIKKREEIKNIKNNNPKLSSKNNIDNSSHEKFFNSLKTLKDTLR